MTNNIVIQFLQNQFRSNDWQLTPTSGRGQESYFASNGEQELFVKIGANLPFYQTMSAANLTPPVLAADTLLDGSSILVQPKISGRTPSRPDFQANLEKFTSVLRQTHQTVKKIIGGNAVRFFKSTLPL